MSAMITAAVVGVVSVAQQVKAGRDAKKAAGRQNEANRQAREAEGKINELQAQRDRIAQVREARIRRSQIEGSAGSQGLGAGTSGVSGGTSSVSSQAASNIGAINVMQTFAEQASALHQQAANEQVSIFGAQNKAQTWQAIGGIAGGAFDQLGGWTRLAGGSTFQGAKPSGGELRNPAGG